MRSLACAMLCAVLLVTGCSAMRHGAASRVDASKSDVQNAVATAEESDRQSGDEARPGDADGRKRTQANTVSSQRSGLKRIEPELFEEALRASDERTR